MDNAIIIPCDNSEVSDGYHTFGELYEHRALLFVSLVNSHKNISWKSKRHVDGELSFDGFFVAGMDLPSGTITYHIQKKYWNVCKVLEIERSKFDGHTSIEVLRRIEESLKMSYL